MGGRKRQSAGSKYHVGSIALSPLTYSYKHFLEAFSTKYAFLDEREYSTPSDKIGSNYSPYARVLTMQKLIQVLSDTNTNPSRYHRAVRDTFEAQGATDADPRIETPITQTKDMRKREVMTAEELLAWDPFREKGEKEAAVEEQGEALVEEVRKSTERFFQVAAQLDICDAAGRRIELSPHDRRWEEHIFDSLPATPDVESMKRQEVVALLLEEVRRNYFHSLGVAIASYHLMDPSFCSQHELDPELLVEPRTEWTSTEFTSREWKVIRKTGVAHDGVVSAMDNLSESLHISTVLVQLQQLWDTRSVPCSASDGTCAFVDVGTREHQHLLPMNALAFVKHSETVADSVRKDLKQKWLAEASSMISSFVENPPEEQRQENFATKLLNAASTLMSRQVRGAVDDSVLRFTRFFEDYIDPVKKCETTAIILDLELGEGMDSIVFSPTFLELKEGLSNCLDYVVGSARRLVSVSILVFS